MGIQLKNNASGTLATAISASDTGIVLTTGNGASFPALGATDYFYATLESTGGTFEVIKVTVRSGDSMTVVRAQEGSTANSFAAGARFELRVTAQSVADIAQLYATDADISLRNDLAAASGSSIVGFQQAGSGTALRTAQAKLRETVSALDFGADPTGVADSTAAIQAAINAAPYSLIVPKGTYRTTATLVINKNMEIDFCGSTIYTTAATAFSSEGTLTATTTAASYTDATDRDSIVVANATGFAVGDIINVISDELFDTSRNYYYKGGSAIITDIVGTRIYFALAGFGYDIGGTIVVKNYSPVTVQIRNIKLLESTAALSASLFGFDFAYHKYSVLSNVTTNLFRDHISIKRSVGTIVENCETRTALNSPSDPWDGYGIIDYSCNGTIVNNCIAATGQHGVTTGGREVTYNFSLLNSVVSAERFSLGFGPHENQMRCIVDNCELMGAVFTGQCFVYNSKFTPVHGKNDPIVLICGEAATRPNYYFENCDFSAISSISLLDYFQVACPTRKYAGGITFNNCVDARLRLDVNSQSAGVKVAEVDSVTMTGCSNFRFTTTDKLTKLTIENSSSSANANIISQGSVGGVFQNIAFVRLNNIELPARFRVIALDNVTDFYMGSYRYNGIDYNNGGMKLNNISTVTLDNVISPSVDVYGFELSAIGTLQVVNSNVKLDGGLAGAAAASTVFTARNSTLATERVDVWTAASGTKYKVAMGTGTFTITSI